ncbi:hypothetical protein GUJ93_ZPchr0003g17637 [Zizania palustris]|uniref:Peptidase C14 caspase domain-containing protein n=1 Tax=Zizania palustris TaxID=103762 RepID=A0A8J5VED6_ZIZPA|nr:hypothetical protein GUJ93_ZPchr0003g17637 [Zizania palustris]
MKCRYCRATLPVIPGARAIQCAQCNGVTRVRLPRPASRPGNGILVQPGGGGYFPGTRSKKRAVLIGITYAGMRRGGGQLRGPINDVMCMRYMLCERFGFPNDGIVMLTDEERDPRKQATKENIRRAMDWLVQGCSYGDSLVFQFSGQGVQVEDEDGDEMDGYDEAICPMDSFQQGPILDDEINEAIVRPLVHGAKLHAVVDAEHSSTVLDLPFLCRISRKGTNWQWEDHRPPTGAYKGTSGGQAILFSGCSDGEKRPTMLFDAPTVGAMTHSFIKAVECEPRATYGRLLTTMKTIMREGGVNCNLQGSIGSPIRKVANFSGVQEPQLSCSEMLDIFRTPFVL